MMLIDIYPNPPRNTVVFLYQMLRERDPRYNISHEKMPPFTAHDEFVKSMPYEGWYLIEHNGEMIGNIYLTERNEIGIFIKGSHQHKGLGKWAIQELMQKHGPRKYYANVNMENRDGAEFFERLGFKPLAWTYSFDTRETHCA